MFKDKLNSLAVKGKITEATASSYYYCIKRLSNSLDPSKLDTESIKSFILDKVKSREELIKYVSAIRKYEEVILKEAKGLLFGEAEARLFTNFRRRIANHQEKFFDYSEDTVLRKINGLRNKKLKYALRLQIKSGLRIKEIADISSGDLKFEDGRLYIEVKEGKGRKARVVEIVEDNYLYDNLKEWQQAHEDGERLFYSRNYLMKKAGQLGIETHDLRRINAQVRLRQELDNGKSRDEAKEVVKKQLGHEKIKTTNIYLRYRFSKIK